MIEIINTNDVVLTAGATIPFTAATYNTNYKTTFVNTANSIQINKGGFYYIQGIFNFTSTAAGDVTINMLADGVVVNGATATVSLGAGDEGQLVIGKYIRVLPTTDTEKAEITFTVSAAGTMTNALASAYKVC